MPTIERGRLLSRRALAKILAGAACARVRAGSRLAWDVEGTPRLACERRYRAAAQVLLFGFPLLHRENVGGGSARWSEFDSGGSTRLLEFRGYSSPDRAAGLNRLGFIREMARAPESGGAECIYFGLMTSSKEESAEEGRRALNSTAKEQLYTAVDGRIAPSAVETAIAHFMAPMSLSGTQEADLLARAHQALASAGKISAPGAAPDCAQSFLQALASLLMRPDGTEARYTYLGRTYRLHLARTPDSKAAAYFRQRHLLAASADVVRVSGKLRRESGGKEIDFRLWIPSAGDRPIPLRIEYQAKSYLRLTFEAV